MASNNGIQFNNLEMTIKAFQKVPNVMNRHIALGLRDALNEIQNYAQHNHPGFTSRSHNLERSITVEPPRSLGTVSSGAVYLDEGIAHYGQYQHEGTGLYGAKGDYIKIFPRNGKMLRWPNAGGTGFIYATKVLLNPGVKGDPFLYNALQNRATKVNQLFNRRVDLGIRESGL